MAANVTPSKVGTASLFRFLLATLFLLVTSTPLFQGEGLCAQVTVGWDPSDDPELSGYKLYYGTASRSYSFSVATGTQTTSEVTGLNEGTTYYFAATVTTTAGVESDFSSEIAYTAPACTSPPGQATLSSPSGTITIPTPTYIWNAVPCSSWYYLWVNDSTGTRVQQWYTAAQAGCASGTGTCSTTPSLSLANGSVQWWIQTWDDAGHGPWSSAKNFSISP